ncbi:type II toxin-antitoxin system HicB family antitoxin [bacterium]|nr:type II toxin-antitoxin system HicB family antitoxin [bacterium]
MKFLVTIERDPESDFFVAECPQLPGCVSQGISREEALVNIKDAIRAIIEFRREQGWPLPAEPLEIDMPELEPVG